MKTLIAVSFVSFVSLFVAEHCQAEDVSATLQINGSITGSTSCSVGLDHYSVALMGDTGTMINQSDAIKAGANVRLNVAGNYSEQAQKCRELADDGKLAYKFVGVADDAEGISLANTDVSDKGAKGVGVGVYSEGTLIRVNEDSLPATSFGNTISLTLVKLNGQQATAGNVDSTMTIQIERL